MQGLISEASAYHCVEDDEATLGQWLASYPWAMAGPPPHDQRACHGYEAIISCKSNTPQ